MREITLKSDMEADDLLTENVRNTFIQSSVFNILEEKWSSSENM